MHHINIQWNWKLQSHSNKATPHQHGAMACRCGVNFIHTNSLYIPVILFLPWAFLLLKATQMCAPRLDTLFYFISNVISSRWVIAKELDTKRLVETPKVYKYDQAKNEHTNFKTKWEFRIKIMCVNCAITLLTMVVHDWYHQHLRVQELLSLKWKYSKQ